MLLLLAGASCTAGDDEPPAEPCEHGDSQCRGSMLQVCEGGAFVDNIDCADIGGMCFVGAAGAQCVGESTDGGLGDAAVDGGSGSKLVDNLPTPENTVYEACESGQAFNPVEKRCVRCPFSACDGPGEAGLFMGTTLDGKCICQTEDGHYRPESGQLSVLCDKDGDGWVSVEARSSIESRDRAYRDNARCHLRTIDRIVLESEGAAEGAGHVVMLSAVDDEVPSVALYEMEVLDDQHRLELDDKVKAYGSVGAPPAAALNSLTKACVDPIADYNGNDVPDIEEWDEYSESVPLWKTFPEMFTYERFAYFTELHTGWFVPDETDGIRERGAYHIRERSRLMAPGEGGLPLGYYTLRRGDDVRWYEHAEHWQVCDRQTDSAFSEARPTRGMDFARYNEGLWNLSSKGGTGNLLVDGDGESDDTSAWHPVMGPLELAAAGTCGAPAPHAGQGFLALGGLCEAAVGSAVATQAIAVPDSLLAQAAGGEAIQVAFGGFLRSGNGADRPAIQLRYYRTGAGVDPAPADELGQSELLWSTAPQWTSVSRIETVPTGTRSIEVRLIAQRQTATSSNEGYFDDLYLRFLSSAPNLVTNAGAEHTEPGAGATLASGWTGETGSALSAIDPECNVLDEARSGRRFFAVAGCGSDALREGRVSQTIEIGDYAEDVTGGNVAAWFGGWVRAGAGASADILLEFLDDNGVMLEASTPLSAVGTIAQWRRLSGQAKLPSQTAQIRIVLLGKRDSTGTAVFDDLFLRLSTGARMFHHSQFKCVHVVQRNDDPEAHPQRLALDRLSTAYELNQCSLAGTLQSAESGPNPEQMHFRCKKPASGARDGTVAFASIQYLHYPLQTRPRYERGCVNECLEVAPDCAGAAPAGSYYACKTDRDYFGTTYCDCAGGYTPWPSCDTCAATTGRWDPAKECRECTGNWDVLEDCAQCLGNFDPNQDCSVCRTHFRDMPLPITPADASTPVPTDNCGTCPDDDMYGHWTGPDCDECSGRWDEGANCLECEGNWDIDYGCEQCLPHFDPTKDCQSCLGNWDGEGCAVCRPNFDPDVDCVACLPNYRPEEVDGKIYCEPCQSNWDPANQCQTCLPGWDEETFCTSCLEGFEVFVPLDDLGNPVPDSERVCIRSNLLENGGAEVLAGVSNSGSGPPDVSTEPQGWATEPKDVIEALYQHHCPNVDHITPKEGLRFFNLGGACQSAPAAPDCNVQRVGCLGGSWHWWWWWCYQDLVQCGSTTSPLWAASQGISLQDLYAVTSDPNAEVHVRLAAWVRLEPGSSPNAGLPQATISLSGYRPNQDRTFKRQCNIPGGNGVWQRVLTEPIKVATNTFSLLFLMGGYLTPGGEDQIYFDDLQLRLCLGDRCDLTDDTGSLNTCTRNADGSWSCDAGTTPCPGVP